MSIIRIDVPGYDTFDGYLGQLEFKGGVSVRSATSIEVQRIGANLKIVEVGNETKQIGPATAMANTGHVSASIETSYSTEPEEPKTEDSDDSLYTEDQLIKIGEDGGIKAVRQIANDYGIKGVSIDVMIKDILEAQKKAA